ncbi:nonribosomal peptide synthetase DhbF [Thermoflexales bacterium]|nr:nonribosomal peptide synthetase DhbF [Thermoflexales bacterium]
MTSTDRDHSLTADLRFTTLVELLHWRALHQPEQLAYTFLLDGEAEEVSFTYQGLDQQARAIGAKLQALGAKGERALLLYTPGLEYIAAFFGCLYAGIIAVPAYPPDVHRLNRTLPRLQAIVTDAQATIVLTTAPLLAMAELLFDEMPDFKALNWIATDTLTSVEAEEWQLSLVNGDDLAFLQYTSGSTAAPRGVMLSHDNLLHNSALIHRCFGATPHSRGVVWLPPYHDMGLIGGILQPLYGGFPVFLMSPIDFLKRPLRWLQALSRYQGTISGGPNFAYDLCVRKISPEEREQLDLSSWELAFNGAEPVRIETLQNFARTFAPCGFRPEAFYPCYGLAEATLIVSGGTKAALPVTHVVDRAALQQHRVEPMMTAQSAAQTLVGCGHTLASQRIVIVNPETLNDCRSEQVGEIWVAGPSVVQGYWNQPEKTAETFGAHLAGTGDGPFLRTGDLGFLHEGELFVTGRLKDLIIIRGRNHYPQDIEQTVERSHPALRPGCCAAFSITVANEEQLVVAQEVNHLATEQDWHAAIRAIRQAVAEEHAVQVHRVALLAAGSILKTSSGKIQRQACRAGFLADSLEVVAKDILEVESVGTSTPPEPEVAFIRQALSVVNEPIARQSLLILYLREQAAHILKIAPAQVDLQQPLSALGLDSLTAIELTHQVETDLGVGLSVVDLLQGSDLAQLATHILAKFEVPAATPAARPISDSESTPEHSLSHGQRAMWFLHQLAPASAAYNIANAIRIEGELDIPALQQAFQALVERHPSLRTTFPVVQGEPVQHVSVQSAVYFQVEEAATWSSPSLDDRLLEEAHRPFDLVQGPLLRVHLFRRSTQECILLLVVHHIVADFWSLAVLVRELGTLYPAQKKGEAITLAPLSLQYSDYAQWQAALLAGAEGEQRWAYWKEQLSGELPVLNLPTDYARPAIQTFHGSSRALQINAELTERLKSFSRGQGATLYTTLLAAFQALLYRYTGQPDILIGSPTANRAEANLAGLVGYFVNPVVVRGDASGNPSFVTFLSRIRQTVLEATAHQAYPFSLLVERLQPQRDPSRSPLFQVWFVLQQSPLSEVTGLAAFALREAGARFQLDDLTLKSRSLEQRATQFDLALAVAETADGMLASLQYNCDLFKADTIDRMLNHFRTLVEGILAEPEQKLSDLPLLPRIERQQILQDWNTTLVEYDRGRCLHHWFEAQATQSPDAVAVIFEGQELTYHELDQRANQLARHLQQRGVGPEVLVALYADRSLEMMIGLLGILKAGGAYLPLDPAYPRDRLAYILEDAQAPVLLTQQRLCDQLPTQQRHIICLDADWDRIAHHGVEIPASEVCATNLAYTIYTSGSTGRPKGVQVTHRAVVNFLNAMCQQPGLTTRDILLSVTTLSFDIAGLELFLPLVVGATVELIGREVITDGPRLAARLSDSGATLMQATPTLWQLLLETDWPGHPHLHALCGGEGFPRDLANRLLEKVAAVWNMYGPTETTIWSTMGLVSPGAEAVSIGRPIANTQIYLLDAYLHPVPLGVAGELYIGGDGLARGYLNQPALTAERFIPHPFSQVPGARLYRTGDLARYRSNGDLEILGRIDHQVKLRGYRVELAEIETLLCQHPQVQAAVVVARDDSSKSGESSRASTSKEKLLVAYVVLHQATAPNELRSFLKRELPDYMVPSLFMTLEALPLTPNGKVDRRTLPAPEGQRPTLEVAYVVPQTQLEQRIAAIWQNVLPVDKVGLHDNFFELGGHSLLMAKVHNQLQAEGLAEALSIVELFQYPTVHSLAGYLSGKESLSLNQERTEVRGARESFMQQQKERRRQLRGH